MSKPYSLRVVPVKRPEYVRGALFSSHAHEWDYKTGVAHVGVGWAHPEPSAPDGGQLCGDVPHSVRRARTWLAPPVLALFAAACAQLPHDTERGLVYSAIVWTRKRRYTKP